MVGLQGQMDKNSHFAPNPGGQTMKHLIAELTATPEFI